MSTSSRDSIASEALSRFRDYTLCPAGITDAVRPSGTSVRPAPLPGALADVASWIDDLKARDDAPIESLDGAIGALRHEKYIDNSLDQERQPLIKRFVRETYYKLRPLMPVGFRKYLQQAALRAWQARPFPRWPVDTSVEQLVASVWGRLLRAHGTEELPFIWFWPHGRPAACIMTHDVETGVGRDFCNSMMGMEASFKVTSAFEVVPEQRYEVPREYLQSIRDGGCEVAIHGLNHDGRLFSSREIFASRVERIKGYAREWNAIGFRSPVMYRNLDWLPELGFSYDMSVPNVGHLDPQPGGCCTVIPYFIGDLLELPLTTIQDYSLFNILGERSTRLWQAQIEQILRAGGLISFIIHPDYITEDWSSDIYKRLLERLAELRDDTRVWLALPREVNDWWRTRRNLRLVKRGAEWSIVGPSAEAARIAFARFENGAVTYRIAG